MIISSVSSSTPTTTLTPVCLSIHHLPVPLIEKCVIRERVKRGTHSPKFWTPQITLRYIFCLNSNGSKNLGTFVRKV